MKTAGEKVKTCLECRHVFKDLATIPGEEIKGWQSIWCCAHRFYAEIWVNTIHVGVVEYGEDCPMFEAAGS